MPKFALAYPYFIIMLCLVIAVVGVTTVVRMPVDLFPQINIPVVVVATFYAGMPPQQIEADITNTFERFFTLGSNIDHIESRSLTGVSLIKVYFKPGTNANAALSNIANLAMADLRRLPPGTLPPVVLKFDASSLPVCLITLKGEGLNETQLKDVAQFQVRNQVANVKGASVPQPFGGTYRQIQVFVDPAKLEAYQLSLMDVVTAVNDSNLILPAGDVRIGDRDYNIYTNSQVPAPKDANQIPLRTIGLDSVMVADVGKAEDAGAIQTNIVRIDGQKSVYHYQIRRVIDVFVMPKSEDLSGVNGEVNDLLKGLKLPKNARVRVQGAVVGMTQSFTRFGVGLLLSIVLVYLILMAQFRSFIDPFIILTAIPPGLAGAVVFLWMTRTTLNIMSLMGIIMMTGIVVSNSILIVEFSGILLERGMELKAAVVEACKVRLRPILMTSLATLLALLPMALGLEAGSEQYAPLARAMIGGLGVSVVLTVFLVPAVYLVIHRREQPLGAS
jgi:multidrug efflux pump subunit AcrB